MKSSVSKSALHKDSSVEWMGERRLSGVEDRQRN